MEIKKKYKLIQTLMILSLVMLSGFSSYWLRNQYLQAKAELRDVMEREYSRAMDQVLDSILYTVYIKPVISDSIELSVEIENEAEKIDGRGRKSVGFPLKITETIRDTVLQNSQEYNNKRIRIIHRSEESDSLSTAKEFTWNQNDILLRSFKLIMSQKKDNMVKDSLIIQSIQDPEIIDLLSSTFTEILLEKGYKFGFTLPKDSPSHEVDDLGGMFISNDNLPFPLPVSIRGTKQYLLKNIFPQFLFVIFLVGLTASAFLLTFRTMKKQVQLNIIRKDFISNMTHELKTPVTTMKVALEALNVYDERKDPGKIEEYLEIATDEINRLDHLMSVMLEQLTLEEKGLSVQMKKINLVVLVNECIKLINTRARAASATIHFQHPDVPLYIGGEEWYIQTAIANIIDNSLKYSGDKPVINLICARTKNEITLEINDQGKGIPQEYKDKIFQKFFRVPTGDKHDIKGHGLGLSLVAQIMKMHGGSVKQKNTKPKGCSFILTFIEGVHEN